VQRLYPSSARVLAVSASMSLTVSSEQCPAGFEDASDNTAAEK